ncbi:DUF3613 domain-containing protein [Caballeronia sp. LZ043]|uniref:DUF3613 domain-containing protein n=1 Tax=unclassified Caballeronia TaxID=2646786 RepID=UPI00385771FD
MKRLPLTMLAAVLGAAPAAAFAQVANPPAASEIGHATQAWLSLQASNAAAAPAQPMLGAEASAAYDRYLRSFETAIPARFGSSLEDAGRPALDVNYHNAN